MKNIFNIDSTTEFPIWVVPAIFIALIVITSIIFNIWSFKGVFLFFGVFVTLLGLFIIYMSLVDKTL